MTTPPRLTAPHLPSPRLSRRQLLTGMAVGGGLFLVGPGQLVRRMVEDADAVVLGPTLDPGAIPQFSMPLIVPPAMPRVGKRRVRGGKSIDYYEISVRQFAQQVLPTTLPPTTVWGYGSARHPGTHNFPSFTIEAKWNAPVWVRWINELVDGNGNPLPHLLPVDPTLHWANPPGPIDHHGVFASTPGPYTGPVPIVTHVHGAHTFDDSDGYPEAWYLPAGTPAEYTPVGTWYQRFANQFAFRNGEPWSPGSATFEYPNDQRATTLWYHDHTLGMTRLNVYAGPAGFYVLRGGPDDQVLDARNGRPATLPGPAPALGDPAGTSYYEIPLAIQDRSFDADGSLFYPDTREFFDGFAGPYAPESDIAPIWNPEFFGNTMLVNGRTWPFLDVEARRYRFRLLNGCQSRFLLLQLTSGGSAVPPMWQIGAEGGFLPAPVPVERVLMGPAERADVIIDFGALPPGTQVRLVNLGPDEPFRGGVPGTGAGGTFVPADAATTGLVMEFRVRPTKGADPSTPPDRLVLPARVPLGPAARSRPLALMEEDSAVLEDVGPRAAVLGPVVGGAGEPKMWADAVTENPGVGDVEEWELHNMTMDAHPMHIHQVQFEVVSRQPMMGGPPRGPEPTETGLKDTVIAYPDEITTVRARFDIPGRFVWHCHIVEHEDNEMMRPFHVGPDMP